MSDLKIDYVPIGDVKPYGRNAKLHPRDQIEQIKKSIEEFGFNDPIAVWHGTIVEGHGRLMAAEQIGMTVVPVIRLDELTDEQRRAYMLVHNKTTMNSDFDAEMLDLELDDIFDIDMSEFGFEPADVITPEEVEAGGVQDKQKAPVAVKMIFENAEKWRHCEDEVRQFVDGLNGVSVSVGEYADQ